MANFKLKNYPLLALLAIVVIIVGGIFHIIALASPYWIVMYERTLGRVGHYGLWVGCKYFISVVTCSTDYLRVEAWLKAVQALDILGMLAGCVALVMMGAYTFVSTEKWSTTFKLSSIISAITAGVLVMIGAIIYGVSVKDNVLTTFDYNQGGLVFNGVYTNDLSWAFGLSITGAILCVISGVLIGFAAKRN